MRQWKLSVSTRHVVLCATQSNLRRSSWHLAVLCVYCSRTNDHSESEYDTVASLQPTSYHCLCNDQALQAAEREPMCHQTWATESTSPCLSCLTKPGRYCRSVNTRKHTLRMSPVTTTVSLTATIVQHRNSCTAIFHILCALKSTRETADQILPLVVLNQHANKKWKYVLPVE